MKYVLAMLLLCTTAGCSAFNANIKNARVNIVNDPTPQIASAMLSHEPSSVALVTPTSNVGYSEAPQEHWDLPPFAWAPSVCTKNSHELAWPDYSAIDSTKCTWWFHPYERDVASCKTTWVLEHNTWAMESMTCRELKQNNIKLRRRGTLKDAMVTRDQRRE